MPNERVLNLPLTSDEIIEVMLQRIEKRMRADCFLHQATTYNAFSYDFTLNIKFKDMMQGKGTLVWDRFTEGEVPADAKAETVEEKFDSGDSPNTVRQDHDMEIPVQVQEGKRTVIRKRKFPKGSAA